MAELEPKDYILGAGVVVTLVLGIWNVIANYRLSRRAAFINTVTSQRIKWIEQLRQDVSAFSGHTHTWCFSALEDKPQGHEALKEIDRLRHVIRLRLNPAGLHDQKIEKLIGEIPNLTHESQTEKLVNALDELTRTTQLLLKDEWEKVKAESKFGDIKGKIDLDA
ncbi:MAG: hypothetical protein ABIR36_13135 [Nitrospiraceae bacterium]